MTTECEGSSRECTRCPTLVTVAPPAPGVKHIFGCDYWVLIAEHQAYAPLRLQEGAGAQCEGVGGVDDDQQDLLRRDRSWSLCQEQEDFG